MAYKPGQREYRNIETTFTATEPENDGDCIVEGYATTFDEAYELYPGYYEKIDRHALDEADMSDVIFQFNHRDDVLARQRNNTLALFIDEHGLQVRANLRGCPRGREVYEGIKNGLVDRMSWGFTVDDDGWEYDRETKTATITRVSKIYDVSAVSLPANEGTEIHARSYLDGVIEMERQELAQRNAAARKRAAARFRLITEGRIR